MTVRPSPDASDLGDVYGYDHMARWLLRCAPAKLLRDESHIRWCLRIAGFRDGLAYLEAELSFLRQDRADGGGPANLIAISVARGRMDRIACGLPPLNLGA